MVTIVTVAKELVEKNSVLVTPTKKRKAEEEDNNEAPQEETVDLKVIRNFQEFSYTYKKNSEN